MMDAVNDLCQPFLHTDDTLHLLNCLSHCRLFGDYKSLESGKARDALEDMMGGVSEAVDLADWRGDETKVNFLFDQLLDAFEDHSLMSASIAVSTSS